MTPHNKQNRILIAGGSSYVGMHIVAALLAEGAELTVLVREEARANFAATMLAHGIQVHSADHWDSASLKGRARGHGTVIHTVGSMTADPAQGLTHHRLNAVSARYTASMCISDGVPHLVLLSAARAPWVSRAYIRAKREAETAVREMGLKVSVVRAPITYVRGSERLLVFRLLSLLGHIPPLSWLGLGRIAPLPVDVLARGVARIALNPPESSRLYFARHLRQLNSRDERRGQAPLRISELTKTPPHLEETSRPAR